ncbi:hypothetical protein GCM10027445_29320 [Amycolatopsis endophytica]|uniref:Putative membrane protein n=1 Tax=Amycolatopsis endophytica TaxID=860233 RepID=A0A853B9H4_9PSEU|nr:hypothetical protein [Amycolatopsis endophytica]NYI91973.1 putative membrane protein [Amycolatopsis endophytica]
MSDTPELDQVADARRRLAVHAQFPVAYWVFFGVGLVVLAGLPIWTTWLGDSPYVPWALAALAIASAVYSCSRRRRSGVHLRKRISAYPSAWPIWLTSVSVATVGFFGIYALVHAGQRGIALAVLPLVAIAVFVSEVKTRSAMRRDIEAGRVRP